jgi:hypothetical protein
MALVDDAYGHVVYGLIIVDPGVEDGVDQWHDDEEDDSSLVLEYLLHLLSPDVAGI